MNHSTPKDLREGYTTGTCAAAAALAAGLLLFNQENSHSVTLELPGGQMAHLPIEYVRHTPRGAQAAVRKEAGDDPDVTNHSLLIVDLLLTGDDSSSPAHNPQTFGATPAQQDDSLLRGFTFLAGEGVGTITLPGLQLSPGEAAINPAPRLQIARVLRKFTDLPLTVRVSIPGGEELAKKTFNPRLGVRGGLSVIGTTGIVRPFSHEALRDAVLCALRVAAADLSSVAPSPANKSEQELLALVPGHYGESAAHTLLKIPPVRIVEVSNEWDCVLPELARLEIRAIWIVGHPGKLAKFALGYFNTHSRCSPSPLPQIREWAAEAGIACTYDGETVEGFFAALPVAERLRLGEIVADEVAQAACGLSGIHCQALLVNMQGEELGRSAECCQSR